MLGQAVQARLGGTERSVVITGRQELDVTDRAAVMDFVASREITHILNCAAYTKVDQAEEEEPAAQAANGDGPGFLAEGAVAQGATLVHVSTDYVFAGDHQVPYRETDPVGPKGVYGRTKLAGEEAIARVVGSWGAPRTPAVILRTSWLFGPGGPNFVATMFRLIRERPELKVVADQIGRPTFTGDLADAMVRAAGIEGEPLPSGTYHFAGEGVTSWHGFAVAIAEAMRPHLGEISCDIAPVTTAEFPRPAPRPAYSVMSTEKYAAAAGAPPPSWRVGLAETVAKLVEE